MDIEMIPVTPPNWEDLQTLFGPRGACGGCWCMFWRMKRSDFDKTKGEEKRLAMQELIHSGEVPGLLAYLHPASQDGQAEPIGWISIGPRNVFPPLERSRVLKPIDNYPVWSIVCFFVARPYRNQGITIRF